MNAVRVEKLPRSASRARAAVRVALASFVLPSVGAGVAFAGPGDHIRAGDATITPSIDIGVEHRTNAYRTPTDVTPGTNLRVAPQLAISARGEQVAFELSGIYELHKYFQQPVLQLDRYSDFGIGARLDLLPEDTVGFQLSNTTGLQSRAIDDSTYGVPYTTQFQNGFDGALAVRAGPVLEAKLGAFWTYNDFFLPTRPEGGGPQTRPYNFRNTAGPTLAVNWNFFPRTAVVFESRLGWNTWQVNAVSTDNPDSELGSYVALPNSRFVQAQAGLRGRITEKFLVIVMAGYGSSIYQEDSVAEEACGSECDVTGAAFAADVKGLDGLLVTTQATWQFGVGQSLSAGYLRNFDDSWFTNYMTYDQVYAKGNLRIGSMLGLSGAFKARFEGYVGEITRSDILLRAEGDVSVQFKDWGAVTAGVWWDERASDPQHSAVEYDDVNIHGLVTFTY